MPRRRRGPDPFREERQDDASFGTDLRAGGGLARGLPRRGPLGRLRGILHGRPRGGGDHGIPGASQVFERGFVTYSNLAKIEMLDVSEKTLEAFGAVSRDVALEMARGALARSKADIAVSVTGVAGPGGGSAEKPVGLVHFGCAGRSGRARHVERRFGALSRAEIRAAAVEQALALLLEAAYAARG